jgi:hypothetical protein
MQTIFKDQIVTRDAILKALNEFAALYPNTNDYDEWLEKGTYHFAIEFSGKLYPPKHILSEVLGFDTSTVEGGKQTNRVFRALGFNVVDKR